MWLAAKSTVKTLLHKYSAQLGFIKSKYCIYTRRAQREPMQQKRMVLMSSCIYIKRSRNLIYDAHHHNNINVILVIIYRAIV